MGNMTTLDPFWSGDATETSKHVSGIPTTMSMMTTTSLDIYNSTQTNLTTADAPVETEFSLAALSAYLAVRVLWGVLAVFGNSLTIFAVCRFERLQTCTNYLICSLAVHDLLAGVMVPLVVVYELYPSSWFFIPVCLSQQVLALISSGGELLNILYLSIDRYIYIDFPLRYHTLVTPGRVAIVLAITWINLLIVTPTIIFTFNHLQVGMLCRFHTFLNERVQAIYMYPQVFIIFFLTIGFHIAITKIAQKQARQIHAEQQPYNTLAVAINQSTKKISHTLAMVLGLYVFSFIPSVILGGVTYFNKAIRYYDRWSIAFYWTNTWVNPLVYAWRLKDFKIAFRKIFTGTGSFNEIPGLPENLA